MFSFLSCLHTHLGGLISQMIVTTRCWILHQWQKAASIFTHVLNVDRCRLSFFTKFMIKENYIFSINSLLFLYVFFLLACICVPHPYVVPVNAKKSYIHMLASVWGLALKTRSLIEGASVLLITSPSFNFTKVYDLNSLFVSLPVSVSICLPHSSPPNNKKQNTAQAAS